MILNIFTTSKHFSGNVPSIISSNANHAHIEWSTELSIALCQCLRTTCQCENSWIPVACCDHLTWVLLIAAPCRVIHSSQIISKSFSLFTWSMASWSWYSQEPENLRDHCSFKEPLFEKCCSRSTFLMPISYEIFLVRLFILHIAMQPKK